MTDERTGQTWDFTRKGGVLHSEIVTPQAVPIWAGDRERLWNEAEKAEDKSTRRDIAKVAREFRVALPHEVTDAERLQITREFSRYLVDRYGAAVDFSIHEPGKEGDERNHHAHIMMTTRQLGPEGFGAKLRSLDSPKTSPAEMDAIRATFADIQNRVLETGGHAARVDHKSYERQGSDKEATIHLGVAVTAMERNGELTEFGDKNRDISARNAEREALKAEAKAIAAEIIDIEAERAKRAAERDVAAAVRTFDPVRILDSITANKSTFTRADLNYALSKEITDAKERAAMNDAILARPEVVALREQADGPVTRYTTRAVLDAERDVLADTASMASDTRHGLTSRQQAEALDHHAHLDTEQRAAFAHATGPEGFVMIAGEAGTGKSATMAPIRDAYEAAGHRVVGMSWTNEVVQAMRRDGFAYAETAMSELFRLEQGWTRWGPRTVVMVDEAAMLSTKHLAAVVEKAKDVGAKLILVGDDRQLASIERGGMFGALKEEHGAAELHTVRRVTDADQKAAFNMMHRGEFRPALDIFEQRGAIRWTDTQDAARGELVAKYRADIEADPAKSRFAFAYTNAEVADLNRDIRAMQRERGALGADHRLETKHGPQDFATGDRVQFTANAQTRAEKAAGFVNGAVGTVLEIDGQRMTVELDGGKPGKPRLVAFEVKPDAGGFDAIRHGYAGTIYKGQGKTLDQTYLLHSKHWRESSSYVAWTRHRDEAAVFVAKDTAKDLNQLARQMARVEDRRAASQFHSEPVKAQTAERPADRGGDTRQDFAPAATEAARRPQTPTAQQVPSKAPEPAPAAPTASQTAEAQRKAALIGRIKDPAKQAAALWRLHKADAIAIAKAGRPKAEAPAPTRSSGSGTREERRNSAREALAQVRREAAKEREAERPQDHQYQRERPRGRTR
jgi:Ti-type conjugative transfer relaxase TraA